MINTWKKEYAEERKQLGDIEFTAEVKLSEYNNRYSEIRRIIRMMKPDYVVTMYSGFPLLLKEQKVSPQYYRFTVLLHKKSQRLKND